MFGLENLPPEISKALEPILQQFENRLDESMKLALTQVNQIVESALDRIDGAQVVVVCTVKLPQVGSQMAKLNKP